MPKPKLLQFPDRTDDVSGVLIEALERVADDDVREIVIFMTTRDENLIFHSHIESRFEVVGRLQALSVEILMGDNE